MEKMDRILDSKLAKKMSKVENDLKQIGNGWKYCIDGILFIVFLLKKMNCIFLGVEKSGQNGAFLLKKWL